MSASSYGGDAHGHIIGHFGESFQAIVCTGTDNQEEGNKTPNTP